MKNIVTATFQPGYTTAKVLGLWQYDYGQILRIQGLELPDAVEIHFSLQEKGGESERQVGLTRDGVTEVAIPNSYLENAGTSRDYSIYAFLYISDGKSGNTEYKITMYVQSRPEPKAPETPEDPKDDPFGKTIEAVNKAMESTKASAEVAADSAKSASKSATQAEKSAVESQESAKAAATSEKAAATSATAAAKSERQARESATIASSAADRATESATAAAESATTATQLAENAARFATNASRSAESASQSAETAKTAADTAEKSASAAQQAAGSAAESASTATVAAQTATTAAGNAAESATTAAQSAETARQKATAAETSASNAAESATAAEKSAIAAGDSSSAAKASETAAEEAAQTAQEQAERLTESAEQIEKNKAGVAALKEDKVDKPSISDDGKIPRAKDGGVEWVDVGQPTDGQTENAVTKWLDKHPEVTTTVQDGAIAADKLSDKLKLYVRYSSVKERTLNEIFKDYKYLILDENLIITSGCDYDINIIGENKKIYISGEYHFKRISISNASIIDNGYAASIYHGGIYLDYCYITGKVSFILATDTISSHITHCKFENLEISTFIFIDYAFDTLDITDNTVYDFTGVFVNAGINDEKISLSTRKVINFKRNIIDGGAIKHLTGNDYYTPLLSENDTVYFTENKIVNITDDNSKGNPTYCGYLSSSNVIVENNYLKEIHS